MTPAKNFRLFGYFPVTRSNDTGDKFIGGVVDTAEKFFASDFDTIQNGPNGILGGLGGH